jgi:hypothetical protein
MAGPNRTAATNNKSGHRGMKKNVHLAIFREIQQISGFDFIELANL